MKTYSTTPEELFGLIGELYFINHKLTQENTELHRQIFEMSEVITKLREEKDGRLEQPANNNAV